MERNTQVLVIGGGIAGVSTLYHLAHSGWNEVALVERAELTAGSTWHAAGNLPHFNNSYTVMRMQQYGIALYDRIEAETGQDVGHHRTGALRLAHTQGRMDEFRRVTGLARRAGLDFRLLAPEEIRDYCPYLETDGLVGGLWDPDDGHIDPTSVTNALARGARASGATIYRNTPVASIHRRDDGLWEVVTAKGVITASILVNAAGFRANEIAAMVGHELPMVSMEHQYLVTGEIPTLGERDSELPMVRDPDVSYYLRQERGGLIVGPYEPDATPWAVDGVPPQFGQKLLAPALDRLEDILVTAMEQMPLLGEAGIQTVVNGPVTYTPDGSPLIGPVAGIDDYFVCTGFSFGIVQGGGAGRFMAEWISRGHTELDTLDLDPRRFGDFATRDYTAAKATEVYAREYATGYPGEYALRPAGRPARTTPIHERLAERGAVFEMRFGWERPGWFVAGGSDSNQGLSFRRSAWFDSIGEECRAVREGVGVLDLTAFAKFEVSGADVEAFLDRVLANRLPSTTGGIALCHMLYADGGICAEFTITRLGEQRFYLVSAASAQVHNADELRRRQDASESVSIVDITGQYATLVLAGPRARDVLAKLTHDDLSDAGFPWFTAQSIDVRYTPVCALRLNFVGELGWELHHPIEHQQALYDALMEAGAAFGIRDFGLRAMESLRLEKGYRMWGSELTCESTPLEAGLGFCVKLTKGDFIGRKALSEQRQTGLERRLVCLAIDTVDVDAIGQEPVWCGEAIVGYVTSGSFGHTISESLALAYVQQDSIDPAYQLEAELLDRRYPARILDDLAVGPDNHQRLHTG